MFEIIKEHKENFSKIFKLAKVDLIKSYKGSFLGWLWTIIKPGVTIFVYWFTIEIGLKTSKFRHGYPNFLWLIASIVPWFYFSEMITGGPSSLRNYNYLVTKLKFPISIIPTIINISRFSVHILLELFVILIFMLNGYPIDSYVLQIFFYMLMGFLFFEAWGLFSSVLGAISKDFLNLIKSINILVFWMSGILWDVDAISIVWVKKLLLFNPIAYLIDGYRNCFINKIYFYEQPVRLLVFIGILLALTTLAGICHKKLRKDVPDVL